MSVSIEQLPLPDGRSPSSYCRKRSAPGEKRIFREANASMSLAPLLAVPHAIARSQMSGGGCQCIDRARVAAGGAGRGGCGAHRRVAANTGRLAAARG